MEKTQGRVGRAVRTLWAAGEWWEAMSDSVGLRAKEHDPLELRFGLYKRVCMPCTVHPVVRIQHSDKEAVQYNIYF